VGLTKTKGFAVFAIDIDKPIVIVPVGDRDRFLAAAKGEKGTDYDKVEHGFCKTVKNVYACTEDTSLFDRLGKGDLTAQRSLITQRGDIEFAGPVPGTPLSQAGSIQLRRGSLVVRAAAKGWPTQFTQLVANTKPRTNGDKTAGFMVLAGGAYLKQLQDSLPPIPIVQGVTLDTLARAVEGPLTMTIDNGALAFDLRLPLVDPAPVQQLLDQCDQLPGLRRVGSGKDGTCRLSVPLTPLYLEAWIEDKTLHVGQKDAPTEVPMSPLSPIANELAHGDWVFAIFGRGSVFSTSGLRFPLPTGGVENEVFARMMSTLSEFGVGVRLEGDTVHLLATVRTLWSNPDDVVAELLAIDPADIASGKAAERAKAIADRHPASEFASDFKSGASGFSIPFTAAGMIAELISRMQAPEPPPPAE
jgi:hypothetical protein